MLSFVELCMHLNNVLSALRAAKPNDRSELDRRYAVTITELEKVVAYFSVYCMTPGKEVEVKE